MTSSSPRTINLEDGTVVGNVLLDGRGTSTTEVQLPDGTKYVGGLKLFKRDGVGALQLPDGKSYAGAFADGCRDGVVSSRAALPQRRLAFSSQNSTLARSRCSVPVLRDAGFVCLR
jgi:hypothetical protein